MATPSRCFTCETDLDESFRYCPQCGVRLDSGVTETGWPGAAEAAARYQTERPRLFGVPPQDTMLVIGLAGLVLGAVLVAAGRLLPGALVLLAAGFTLVVYAEGLRRRPSSTIARHVMTWLGLVRAQLGYAGAATAAFARARTGRARLGREAAALTKSRRGHLLALGEAAYEGDTAAAETSRQALERIDERISAKATEIERLERRAKVTIRAARFWRAERTAAARGHGETGKPVGVS